MSAHQVFHHKSSLCCSRVQTSYSVRLYRVPQVSPLPSDSWSDIEMIIHDKMIDWFEYYFLFLFLYGSSSTCRLRSKRLLLIALVDSILWVCLDNQAMQCMWVGFLHVPFSFVSWCRIGLLTHCHDPSLSCLTDRLPVSKKIENSFSFFLSFREHAGGQRTFILMIWMVFKIGNNKELPPISYHLLEHCKDFIRKWSWSNVSWAFATPVHTKWNFLWEICSS